MKYFGLIGTGFEIVMFKTHKILVYSLHLFQWKAVNFVRIIIFLEWVIKFPLLCFDRPGHAQTFS